MKYDIILESIKLMKYLPFISRNNYLGQHSMKTTFLTNIINVMGRNRPIALADEVTSFDRF